MLMLHAMLGPNFFSHNRLLSNSNNIINSTSNSSLEKLLNYKPEIVTSPDKLNCTIHSFKHNNSNNEFEIRGESEMDDKADFERFPYEGGDPFNVENTNSDLKSIETNGMQQQQHHQQQQLDQPTRANHYQTNNGYWPNESRLINYSPTFNHHNGPFYMLNHNNHIGHHSHLIHTPPPPPAIAAAAAVPQQLQEAHHLHQETLTCLSQESSSPENNANKSIKIGKCLTSEIESDIDSANGGGGDDDDDGDGDGEHLFDEVETHDTNIVQQERHVFA